MMDSVREKEEKEGKTVAVVGVFVLPEREKKSILCCLLFSSLLIFAVILEFILFSLLNEKVCVFLLYSLCRVGVCLACSVL